MLYFQPRSGSFPQPKIHSGIPDPPTTLYNREDNVHVQVSFIAMHNIEDLSLARSDLGHRLFRQLNGLLGSEPIRCMLSASRKKAQHGVNKIILRWLFPATLCRCERPQCRGPLLGIVEWRLTGQHRQRIERFVPQHPLV
nr:hypothetical protein [Pseudomonas insulae]